MRIAIVGGSIAGCAAAVELGDAGHDVSVHERSPGELTGRGIGIMTDDATMARLIDRGLVDPSTPRVPVEAVRYIGRASPRDGATRRLGDVVSPLTAFHWSDLHRGLRAQVPDASYTAGHEVAVDASGVVAVGSPDLVVFADGYLSAGRRLVAPEAEVGYRGLVLWRGLVPESEVDVERVEGVMTRIVYPGGHGVAYLIPGPGGADGPGERRFMWGFYLSVPEEELDTVLTDGDGQRRGGSVPFGHTADAVATSFRRRLADTIPDAFLDLVDRCDETSLQAIFSVDVEHTHRGRSCLVGDAARVFPPFTLSGVLRAVDAAVGLRESLDEADDVDTALDAWGARQQKTADHVRGIAERTERALVHEVPDLSGPGTEAAERLLAEVHPGATLRMP